MISALAISVYFSHKHSKIALKEEETPMVGVVHEVSLYDNRAEPNELVVKLIDKVQFNSKNNKMHDVALGKGNDYGMHHEHAGGDSGIFGAGEGYIVSFKKVGTYYFHDDLNPNIFVTVLVY